ncbi:hypothetical protein PI124_g21970 [Phytophthora idaei]|nr:hypothetical protein PI125_g2042 [Phytophthora idaei]KAG3232952.1 hypothetical protein PI124_g21970 [Phytophthora idaei]
MSRARQRQAIHQPLQNDEWRAGNNQKDRKRRTRACKCCSLLKGTDNARGGDSSIYSSACKLPTTSKAPKARRVFLCDKVQHTVNGDAVSCFGIWHQAWKNGSPLPNKASKRTNRARRPAGAPPVEEGDGEEDASSSGESSDSSQHPRKHGRRAGETVGAG